MSRFVLAPLLLLVLPCSAAGQSVPDSGDVVINEVMYAPSPSSNEFIELYNRSDQAVNLGRLEYADENRDFAPVASSDTLLEAGDYVVLVRDTMDFRDAFPSVAFLAPDGWDALNNGGDTVVLRDAPSGTTIDAVPYDPSWGGSDGNALERIDPDGPSNRPSNFGPSEADAGATPAAQNSIYNPDETPPTLDRVTPSPSGDSLFARFSEPVDPSTVSASAFALEATDTPAVNEANPSDTSAVQVVCVLDRALSTGSFTLLATDVADPSGNVQPETAASFRYFVPEVPTPKDLVITELLYAPAAGATEFIEIYNRSDKTVDLGALEYADEDRDFNRFASRRLTPLAPDSHAVIARDGDAFASSFPDASARVPNGWDALNNGGDTVLLRYAPSGTVIDSVPYEPSWGGDDGASLERIDPAGPSTAASNFGTSTADAGATPGARNSIFDPDEKAPVPVFAEQVAETTVNVTFSEPLQPASVTPRAFTIGSTPITNARLRRDTLVALTLADSPSSATVQVEGVRDRVGNETSASRTLAFQPQEGQIAINEILFDPRRDDFDDRPNQVEYVELYNRTERPLSLRALFATDRPDERGVADTIRAGRRLALAPRGYGVVAAAPNGTRLADSSQLAAAFPNAPLAADSVAFLPVDAQRLGLGNDGDLIRLHRADGTAIAEVTYSPDWHTPSLEETKGTALERISPTGNASSATNWTSSPNPQGGTPGQKNAASLAPPDEEADSGLTIKPSPFQLGSATRIRYTLDDVPNLVRARIFDARGREVRTLEDARLTGRTGELIWKGRNDNGNRVRIGVYVVLFEAVQAQEGTVARFKKPVVVARPLN